jgi:exopolysaccharide biosynthesis protein
MLGQRRIRRIRLVRPIACLACTLLLFVSPFRAVAPRAQQLDLPEPRNIAPGVLLYHLDSSALVDPEGPVSIWMLRLDPAKVDLQAALSNDEIMGVESVAGIAERHKPIAAINAGFFLPNGDPAGVMAIDGRLVSDTRRQRGAIGISRDKTGVKLVFARLRATASLVLQNNSPNHDGEAVTTIAIDGIDTTRLRGQLMLYTPSYHADTDTAKGGLEWVIDRQRGRLISGPHRDGKTRIPARGFVLSFGGERVPEPLQLLGRATRVRLDVSYEPVEGEPESWLLAQDIVGGAGLLIRDGHDIQDWSIERFNQGFAENRHPRTMIGTAADETIWFVTVDGRQPELSVGMTLVELQALANRLGLVNALNLDGGGSTTMWVQGQVVNKPSDPTGPRKVSDALLVFGVTGKQ